ncbi:MAG: glycosyltransferase family 4 protein [Proteobacteria bacterium]|nr:glycosyltransferase family 4 protein [Pseudomonadota bacterium]
MRIAAYAPLKPPDHPVPSGDRRVARLLDGALALAGHHVEWPSRFRSRDGAGDPQRQARLAKIGAYLAGRLVRHWKMRPAAERPGLWLTYHLYYKAPDHLGPAVARALGIPYVVVEASVAMKRAGGPWDLGHCATLAALAQADAVISLNPGDAPALEGVLEPAARRVVLPPFLDSRPYEDAARHRDMHRDAWARRLKLDIARPWLIAVAMQRSGDKLRSHEILAAALGRIAARDWQLVLVGDGPVRAQVDAAFAPLGPRVVRAGQLDEASLPGLLAASDLFVWPAIAEAYGMAILEAHASGLPVVAGAGPGVAAIVADGATGRLVPAGDVAAFADAVGALLDEADARTAFGRQAAAKVAYAHGLAGAAARLDELIRACRR